MVRLTFWKFVMYRLISSSSTRFLSSANSAGSSRLNSKIEDNQPDCSTVDGVCSGWTGTLNSFSPSAVVLVSFVSLLSMVGLVSYTIGAGSCGIAGGEATLIFDVVLFRGGRGGGRPVLVTELDMTSKEVICRSVD